MSASLPSAVLWGWVGASLAHGTPGWSFSSISPVEFVTATALVCATVFSFLFWYVANKPNVIVKPVFKSGSATVVITNEGRIPARSLRVMSTSLKPVRDSDEALDVRLPAMYPKEQIEYFVAPGHEAVNYEPYEFIVSHRRWLWRWPAERRKFKIDFKQYEAILADLHVSTPFERDLEEIARIGNTSFLDRWGDPRGPRVPNRQTHLHSRKLLPHHGQERHPSVLHPDVDHRIADE